MKTKILILLVSALTTNMLSISTAASNPNVDITIKTNEGTAYLPLSYIYATNYKNTGNGQIGIQRLCPTWDTGACAESEQKNLIAYLPACEGGNYKQCVSGPTIGIDGISYTSRYLDTVGEIEFAESQDGIIPAGGGVPVYVINTQSGQSRLFAVIAIQKVFKQMGVMSTGLRVPVIRATLSAEIAEVRIESFAGSPTQAFSKVQADGSEYVYLKGPIECLTTGRNKCLNKLDKLKFSAALEMKLSKRFNWLHGRLDNMDLESESISNEFAKITVRGDSIKTYEVIGTTNAARLPKPSGEYGIAAQSLKNGTPVSFSFSTAEPETFPRYTGLLPYLDIQKYTENESWNIKSMDGFQQNCMSKSGALIGGLATNSIMYDSFQPKITENGIDYSLSSPHSINGKDPFIGFYNLIMSEEAARCFYNLKSAQISAEVAITNDDGLTNVQTTTFNQKSGWIKVNVSGFHFSSPKINVKLKEVTPVVSEKVAVKPEVEPEIKILAPKKTVIKCSRKNEVKKVSGSAPKCPKGFKRTA